MTRDHADRVEARFAAAVTVILELDRESVDKYATCRLEADAVLLRVHIRFAVVSHERVVAHKLLFSSSHVN